MALGRQEQHQQSAYLGSTVEYKQAMAKQPRVYHHQYQQIKTGAAEMCVTARSGDTSGYVACIHVSAQTQSILRTGCVGSWYHPNVRTAHAHCARTVSRTPPLTHTQKRPTPSALQCMWGPCPMWALHVNVRQKVAVLPGHNCRTLGHWKSAMSTRRAAGQPSALPTFDGTKCCKRCAHNYGIEQTQTGLPVLCAMHKRLCGKPCTERTLCTTPPTFFQYGPLSKPPKK